MGRRDALNGSPGVGTVCPGTKQCDNITASRVFRRELSADPVVFLKFIGGAPCSDIFLRSHERTSVHSARPYPLIFTVFLLK